MKTYLRFDRDKGRRIHFGLVLFLAGAVSLLGCDDKQKDHAPGDAAEKPKEPVTEIDKPPPGEVDAGTSADEQDPETGVFNEEDGAMARAVGKARKSRDISLSRQAAANRARAELDKILKEKGYSLDSPEIQHGVTIERIYIKGDFVYAVATTPLPEENADPVNVPDEKPSNPDVENQPEKTTTSPNGG